MKGKTFKLFFGFVLMLTVGLVLFLYYYNKPHVNVHDSDVAFSVTAEHLIDEYQNDEYGTTQKYAEYIIEVIGEVHEITTSNGSTVVTIKPTNSESSIICNMQVAENLNVMQLQKGDEVRIKGVCSGYLLDVIMVRCILVE
jgi:hypothetical protein